MLAIRHWSLVILVIVVLCGLSGNLHEFEFHIKALTKSVLIHIWDITCICFLPRAGY